MILDSPLVAAVQFLTRFPVPVETTVRARAEAPRWYPVVGGLVGLVGAAVHAACALRLPAVAPVVGILATVVATGALHEDGLADTADAAGLDRERARTVMKDPRLGTHGVIALCASLALRVLAVSQTDGTARWLAYLAAGVLGRAAAVAVMCSLPYAYDDGARRTGDAAQGRFAHLAWSAVSIVTLGGLCARLHGLVPFGVACASSVVVARLATHRLRAWLGGVTGDTLGAVEQVVEVVVFLSFAATVAP